MNIYQSDQRLIDNQVGAIRSALETNVYFSKHSCKYVFAQRFCDNTRVINIFQVFYEYRYTVEDPISGVISEKWENRLGDYVKGRYSFLQADGLVRTVHYESDSTSGFRAIVQTSNPGRST